MPSPMLYNRIFGMGGVKRKKPISVLWIPALLLIQVAAYVLLHNTNYYIYAPIAIAMALVAATIFAKIKNRLVMRVARSLGTVSLESYLSNVVLIDVVSLVPAFSLSVGINKGNYLYYATVVLLTVIFAYVVSAVSNKIIKRIH